MYVSFQYYEHVISIINSLLVHVKRLVSLNMEKNICLCFCFRYNNESMFWVVEIHFSEQNITRDRSSLAKKIVCLVVSDPSVDLSFCVRSVLFDVHANKLTLYINILFDYYNRFFEMQKRADLNNTRQSQHTKSCVMNFFLLET